MHRKVAAAFVAVLALGIASCGSSEQTLSKADLVSRIQLACREGKRAVTRASSEARGAAGEPGRFVAGVVADQRMVLKRIEGVTTSGSAKSDFDALKQAMQQRLALIERVQKAGTANFRSTIRAVQAQAQALTSRAEAAEKALGVSGCN